MRSVSSGNTNMNSVFSSPYLRRIGGVADDEGGGMSAGR
jgi:hypothetical protein